MSRYGVVVGDCIHSLSMAFGDSVSCALVIKSKVGRPKERPFVSPAMGAASPLNRQVVCSMTATTGCTAAEGGFD